MAKLPKLPVPTYTVKCPSGQTVTFRPFLVKEEKLLLIAGESKDPQTMVNTAREILENCITPYTPTAKVDKMPIFDIEFLFLNIRARSVGEIVKLKYQCNQTIGADSGEQKLCKAPSEYEVNLLKITPTVFPDHNKYIQLTPEIGMTMKYPTFKSFSNISRKDMPADEAFNFILDCVESINTNDEVFTSKDVPKEELVEFINTLSHTQLEGIDKFFETMPKIEQEIQFVCPKCAHTEKLVVRGLENFFV